MKQQLHEGIDDGQALQFLMSQNHWRNKSIHFQFIRLNDSIKKSSQQCKNQFAKIKYDAANMENIQIKAQRAETLHN
jgi:hypothetical protein